MRYSKFLAAALVLAGCLPAGAIVVCHDYTYWRVFEIDPTPPIAGMPKAKGQGVNTARLRADLEQAGYRAFDITTTARMDPATAQRHLKAGDVIILGDAHSGYVADAGGHIDHWLQVYGESGLYRAPNDHANPLPAGQQGKGGLFLGDDLATFLARPAKPNLSDHVVIWRKSEK